MPTWYAPRAPPPVSTSARSPRSVVPGAGGVSAGGEVGSVNGGRRPGIPRSGSGGVGAQYRPPGGVGEDAPAAGRRRVVRALARSARIGGPQGSVPTAPLLSLRIRGAGGR